MEVARREHGGIDQTAGEDDPLVLVVAHDLGQAGMFAIFEVRGWVANGSEDNRGSGAAPGDHHRTSPGPSTAHDAGPSGHLHRPARTPTRGVTPVSEANKAWRFEAGGQEHEVEIEHSTMTGKILVKVDGKVVDEDRMLARKKTFAVDLDGQQVRVDVDFAFGGFSADSTLHLDNRYVEPLRR